MAEEESTTESEKKDKKRKQWETTAAQAKKKQRISVDPAKQVKGVLVSTDTGKERQSTNEMQTWLSEYVEKLYPGQPQVESKAEAVETKKAASVSAALDGDIEEMEKEKKGHKSGQGIEALSIEINGLIFFQIPDPRVDPVHLVKAMLTDIKDSHSNLRTRFSARLQPVATTCFSSQEELVQVAKPLIDKAFAEFSKDKSYAIEFKRHGQNKQMDRMQCINAVAKLVPEGFKVNLNAPDIVICIDIIRRFTTLSIVTQYQELKKFSIRGMADIHVDAHGNQKEGKAPASGAGGGSSSSNNGAAQAEKVPAST